MIRLKLAIIAFILIGTQHVFSQEDNVSGTVTDKSNLPLPGVTVLVKGTTNGALTDFDGNYELQGVSIGDIIVFSYVGMQTTQKIIVDSRQINVVMIPEATDLEQVVVIGYGQSRKKDLTSAISTISGDVLEKQVVTNIDQGIQGLVSGVTVTRSTGRPGGAVSVRIRGTTSVTGSNEPLYIIDGVNVQNSESDSFNFSRFGGTGGQTAISPLSALNPNDIESITVLKDASAAAIYGAQSSNGVVLITTKRGKAGKAKISYETYAGIQTAPKLLDMMNLREFAVYSNEVRQSPSTNLPSAPQFENPNILGDGTNWQRAIFRAAPITNHQLSISGGKEKTKFYASANYFDQEGIVINSGLRRFGLRLNLDYKYNDWIKFGHNINLSSSLEQIGLNDSRNGTIINALRQTPNVPVRNPDGTFGSPENGLGNTGALNPVAASEIRNSTLERFKMNGNIYLDLKLANNLKFRTDLGYDYNTAKTQSFFPTYDFGSLSNRLNSSFRAANEGLYYLFKNYLTYTPSIGNHNFDILLGTEAQKTEFQGLSGQRSNFPSNDVPGLNTGDAETSLSESFEGAASLLSYFGRINYDYNSKYLFSASLRYDGSSKFGPNNRWGLFPSVSAAWVVSDEPFMESISSAWSYFKIRAGYGTSGNQDINNFLYLSFLRNQNTALGSGFSLANFNNPNIAWESLISPNLGVELGFLDNNIRLDVDVYRKTSKDFLATRPIPGFLGSLNTLSFIGVNAPVENFGEMINDGIDLTLNTKNITNEKFSWDTNIVFSLYRNEITELSGDNDAIVGTLQDEEIGADLTRSEVGQPIGMFYGFVTDGLFRDIEDLVPTDPTATPAAIPEDSSVDEATGTWLGDVRFKDLNGDGVIDDNDRTFIGNPHPDFTFSITNNFRYGMFDLSVFLQGTYGNDIYNYTRTYIEGVNRFNANQATSVIDRYSATNTDGSLPRYSDADKNGNNRVSDRFIEDGSYLRIQSVTLGCTLPKGTFGEKIKFFDQIRVYTTIQNLYTFTNYSGYDPEVGSLNQSALFKGIDFGRYPVPRTMTLGLNVQF
ncbi:TonB-dependent receptor [uncultured Aquimarina sp.]|uniref:SusC/RagA family TonB-linked outer membrane protein n=1 Tax=uncultured Aquimarina sp. TaxID=575652 RepID=UPI00260BC78A|nr:TonB-dependent receptor [uncultured Aquimarina sp.]